MRLLSVLILGLAISVSESDEPRIVPAPELTDVSDWINTKPLKIAELKGRVVVVHFWTHGCINCVNNYSHYKSWCKDFQDEKLTMIGVHTPEFDSEKKLDALKAAVKKHELPFAVAVDNEGKNWKAWNNRYWPCVYIVDRAGKVRYHWEGELGPTGEPLMRKRIRELLAEK